MGRLVLVLPNISANKLISTSNFGSRVSKLGEKIWRHDFMTCVPGTTSSITQPTEIFFMKIGG